MTEDIDPYTLFSKFAKEWNDDTIYIVRRGHTGDAREKAIKEGIVSPCTALNWHMHEIEREYEKGNVSERAFSHIIGMFQIAKEQIEGKEKEDEE